MKYNNLVISGGGLKGYYFLGALKYLFDNNLFKLKKILGVSIGGFFAYLLSINYTIYEIIDIFLKINLEKYTPEIVLDNIFDEYYCCDNSKLKKIINYLSKKKNISMDITLEELYNITQIELVFGTCNLTDKVYEYISFKTYPKLSISIALEMTMALPLIFKPVKYNNKIYVDGGMYNNYPINYFKNDIKNTIGILLKKNINLTDLFSYIGLLIDFIGKDKRVSDKYYHNSIKIEPFENFSILDFDNIQLTKNLMIQTGYTDSKKFFEKYQFIEKILLNIIKHI
jgi:NTE family protein